MKAQKIDTLVTLKEAAAELRLSPGTLRGWVREGKIPGYQFPSGIVAFERRELDVWKERHHNSNRKGATILIDQPHFEV